MCKSQISFGMAWHYSLDNSFNLNCFNYFLTFLFLFMTQITSLLQVNHNIWSCIIAWHEIVSISSNEAVMSGWFDSKRPLALSIGMTGISVFCIAFPVKLNLYDWQHWCWWQDRNTTNITMSQHQFHLPHQKLII